MEIPKAPFILLLTNFTVPPYTNLIYGAIFLCFLVFSIYYLVKFLRLTLGKSKKELP